MSFDKYSDQHTIRVGAPIAPIAGVATAGQLLLHAEGDFRVDTNANIGVIAGGTLACVSGGNITLVSSFGEALISGKTKISIESGSGNANIATLSGNINLSASSGINGNINLTATNEFSLTSVLNTITGSTLIHGNVSTTRGAGASADSAKVGGLLHYNTSLGSTVHTSAVENFLTGFGTDYTLATEHIKVGTRLKIMAGISVGSNSPSNDLTVKLYMGGTILFNGTFTAPQSSKIGINAELFWTVLGAGATYGMHIVVTEGVNNTGDCTVRHKIANPAVGSMDTTSDLLIRMSTQWSGSHSSSTTTPTYLTVAIDG
jgi:hypothetical protein